MTAADAPTPLSHEFPPRLERRALALAARGGRTLLGIAGPPGAGKSTLAAAVAAAVEGAHPGACAVVPMDGFHLAQGVLRAMGREGRKGAPDTFDAHGYVALLGRLRRPREGETVYAPRFDREVEEPIAGAVAVPPSVRLVVTEGNYLLLDDGPWAAVRGLLDEVWYVDPGDAARVPRLVARHVAFGRTPADAAAWERRTDAPNAALVARIAARADVVWDGSA